jgi:hypothetical protein
MPLMNGAQLLARARKYADDFVEPYFTPDDEMYLHISEAERQLALAGKLIRDVRRYKARADKRWLDLTEEPEIMEFRTAWVEIPGATQRFELLLRGVMDSSPAISSFYDDYGATASAGSLRVGRPQMLRFGTRTNYAELVPIPDKDYVIEAAMVFYPESPIAAAGDFPQIAERYHAHIPVGAALLAMEAMKHEYPPQKIQNLETAWQQVLFRVQKESGEMNRDASVVRFTNDMWEGS